MLDEKALSMNDDFVGYTQNLIPLCYYHESDFTPSEESRGIVWLFQGMVGAAYYWFLFGSFLVVGVLFFWAAFGSVNDAVFAGDVIGFLIGGIITFGIGVVLFYGLTQQDGFDGWQFVFGSLSDVLFIGFVVYFWG